MMRTSDEADEMLGDASLDTLVAATVLTRRLLFDEDEFQSKLNKALKAGGNVPKFIFLRYLADSARRAEFLSELQDTLVSLCKESKKRGNVPTSAKATYVLSRLAN